MDELNHAMNNCLSNPGLAISAAASPLVKWANAFTFKAAGRLSGTVAAGNAPSLSTALQIPGVQVNGVSPTPSSLASGYQRAYSLVGTLPVTGSGTATPTFSWNASPDTVANTDVQNMMALAAPTQSNQTIIGMVFIANATGAAFVPGTTALDTANLTVQYINNFGVSGA